ncbi:MAG: zinc-binding alcohol dehydrogenase [Phycisphaeraceae bacterium]
MTSTQTQPPTASKSTEPVHTVRRISFTGKQQVELQTCEPASLGAGDVRVRGLYSLMSTGTENIVFNRLFEPGTHWDQWVKYPFYPGYAMIGQVIEIGGQVSQRQVGQIVALRRGHASETTLAWDATFPVPAGVDLRQATWFALAKIASHGARVAEHALDQSVAIVGAGPVGQMSVRWAHAAGVRRLVVVDMVEGRLALARAGGATATCALPVDQAKDQVWAACDHPARHATPPGAAKSAAAEAGPDVVIEVTGHPAVFAPSLALPRKFGTVVLLGDAGAPAGQHLTPDVITRGLHIVGAHDGHNDDQWNNAIAIARFFELVRDGRFPLDGLITHTFKPGQAAQAYELANTRRSETMGILFDWT